MLRAFSFGGGTQSMCALVLAAERRIEFPLFLFANVGDDSENPATLNYITQIAEPYAYRMGIELVEVRKTETLYARIMRTERSVPIPMRMANGAPGNRQCTQRFKIAPIAAELKARGATRNAPALLALGISLDEYHRARNDSPFRHYTTTYPLLELRLDRVDCQNIISRAGLPLPPKSSCYFCPYQTMRQWRELRRTDPASFEAACALEERKNQHRVAMGRDPVWLSSAARPLREAVTESAQLDMFDGGCAIAGYCHA